MRQGIGPNMSPPEFVSMPVRLARYAAVCSAANDGDDNNSECVTRSKAYDGPNMTWSWSWSGLDCLWCIVGKYSAYPHILANARQVFDDLNSLAFEGSTWPDTRYHQELWRPKLKAVKTLSRVRFLGSLVLSRTVPADRITSRVALI